MTQTAAVTSATGDQGAAIARAFAAAGWRVIGLTRNPAQAPKVAATGAEPRPVDDEVPPALARALEGADTIVFTSPADYRDGVREGLARRYAEAAARAGVRRAVVNTAASVLPGSGPNALMLTAVMDAFQHALPEFTGLEPTIYMDNLAAPWMVQSALGSGKLRYPVPAHARVSWISHATLAAFALAAATSDAALGQRLPIGGPGALTGADVAAALSTALGRTLAYEAAPLSEFIATLNANFGSPAGERVTENIGWLEDHPDAMNVASDSARLLGVTPEPFEAWAKRQTW